VSLALPPAPQPLRPRQLFVATALACGGMLMYFAGLLGVYVSTRTAAGGTTADWLPEGVVIPEVTTNTMLATMAGVCVVAQWAVWSMKRNDRGNSALALGVLVVFAAAMIVMQVNVYERMDIGIADDRYNTLFYGVTGSFLVALVFGLLFTAVMAFRALGGRYSSRDTEGLSSLALFWYALTFVFVSLWYIVYVLK
jgi:heme/copper-type cytochrome/quinol oxidase subunit 3